MVLTVLPTQRQHYMEPEVADRPHSKEGRRQQQWNYAEVPNRSRLLNFKFARSLEKILTTRESDFQRYLLSLVLDNEGDIYNTALSAKKKVETTIRHISRVRTNKVKPNFR